MVAPSETVAVVAAQVGRARYGIIPVRYAYGPLNRQLAEGGSSNKRAKQYYRYCSVVILAVYTVVALLFRPLLLLPLYSVIPELRV